MVLTEVQVLSTKVKVKLRDLHYALMTDDAVFFCYVFSHYNEGNKRLIECQRALTFKVGDDLSRSDLEAFLLYVDPYNTTDTKL